MHRNKAYKRVLLKISGEALKGSQEFGIDYNFLNALAQEIREMMAETKVEVAIVIGGGNFMRGANVKEIDRAVADYMGMLATLINAMSLQSVFERQGLQTRILSALDVQACAEPYIRRRAIRHLEKGRVIIFACGTGSPFFSTDTAAALRGAEISAEVILKATNVAGVYNADPKLVPDAVMYNEVGFTQTLTEDLRVMDATAISLCRENNIPIIVFNLHERGNMKRVIAGERIGTFVGGDGNAAQ